MVPCSPSAPVLNAFDRLPARALALALSWALAVPLPAAAQVSLPALGESAAGDFDVNAERRVGDQIMREIRRDPDYLDDPLLLDHVQTLWRALVTAARQRGEIGADTESRFAWEPFLVRDRVINAFALPGGYIGVYLGLMALTETPDELASVMAHELSHVTQHHIARGISESGRQSVLAMAAMILGVLAASRSNNTDAVQAAVVGSQALLAQGQLNFSRDMEREADRIGYDVLSLAGFDNAGMAGMFEKLDSANRLNDAGQFPYLRSHPLTVERIAEARLRGTMARPGPAARALPTGLATAHALMRARARVWMSRADVSLRREQAIADEPSATATAPAASDGSQAAARATRDRLAALYGSALASSMLRDFAKADERIAQARTLIAQRMAGDDTAPRLITLLQAETMQARGDAPRAVAALQGLRNDGSRPVVLARAQVATMPKPLAAPGNPSDAAGRDSLQELQGWLSAHQQDSLAWQTMAALARSQGLPLRALRAEAESFAVRGDLVGAIDRFRAAQRAAREVPAPDYVESAIVDARLRELEAQRREQMRESRESP
jgi:beta-barrel assembly-enhancing protease